MTQVYESGFLTHFSESSIDKKARKIKYDGIILTKWITDGSLTEKGRPTDTGILHVTLQ